MISVDWKGGTTFEATPPSGKSFVMGSSEGEGEPAGPSPLETFLASAAACSAIDVVLILAKMKQTIESYRIEVEWTRDPEGQYPRPIRSILIRHVLTGNLDRSAVDRAVKLSDEKYCTVVATLRATPTVTSEFRIE